MKPLHVMIGLALAWLLLINGFSRLDEALLPATERQAILASIQSDQAETIGCAPEMIAQLRNPDNQAETAAPAVLLAQK